jgi:hypothetical protein
MRSLKLAGVYFECHAYHRTVIEYTNVWMQMTSRKRIILRESILETAASLIFFKETVEAEKINPVIYRCYPLKSAVKGEQRTKRKCHYHCGMAS